jgi:hypothetical protein
MFVVDQSNQKMFEGRILVPPAAGFAQRIVEGLFEFASETGHLGYYSRSRGKAAGFQNQCHMAERGNQVPVPLFSTDYRINACASGERGPHVIARSRRRHRNPATALDCFPRGKRGVAMTDQLFLKSSSAAER